MGRHVAPTDGRLTVGLDATPLLGPRTGVGTYTHHLLAELAALGPDGPRLVATAFTARGAAALVEQVPDGVRVSGFRAPARLLRAAWQHGRFPPVEVLSGRVDVFHGTNFVAPPTRHAAGVVTIHDLSYLRYPETVTTASLAYRELVPRALARGVHVCTPSEAVALEVRDEYGLPADLVHPTPLGVDPAWSAAGATADAGVVPDVDAVLVRRGIPRDYVVAVGTLEPRKNLPLLLAAYRVAAARRVDLPPLVLVGAGGWGEALDLAGLPPGRVVLPGHVPLADLRQMVAGAALLAFPSRYEGFGLPPLEALACGVPVVASDIPVTREVLGDQALFADPGSAESLLGALETALVNPAGTPATRRARAATFTWQACAAATKAVYECAVRR